MLASGNAEAVLLPGLATLSSDLVVQEIMLWDLRSRGARVLSTDPADLDVLSAAPPDADRQFVRHVLARVAEHGALAAADPGGIAPAAASPTTTAWWSAWSPPATRARTRRALGRLTETDWSRRAAQG